MTPMTKKLLEQVESWPQEDQEELAEYVREIEARRTGVYHATAEELDAIDEHCEGWVFKICGRRKPHSGSNLHLGS